MILYLLPAGGHCNGYPPTAQKCFTGAKEQFFSQKTLKKSVKMGELFINRMNCKQIVEHSILFQKTGEHTHQSVPQENKVAMSHDIATSCKP